MKFEYFFYQNWSFFAPPGKIESNLYYKFYTDEYSEQPSIVYEVTDVITQKKQKSALTNGKYRLIDYCLLGAATGLEELLIQENNYLLFDDDIEAIDKIAYLNSLVDLNENDYPMLVTLTNYSKLLEHKGNYWCEILYTNVPLPPFKERSNILNPSKLKQREEFEVFTIKRFNIEAL